MLLSIVYLIAFLALQSSVLHCFHHDCRFTHSHSHRCLYPTGASSRTRHLQSYSFLMNSKGAGQFISGYGLQSELRMQPQISLSTEVTPSLEIYACEEGTQDLVIGQIANWVRAEVYTLREYSLYSVRRHILRSCGTYVFSS